jgi:hypothetical protein
MHDRGSASGEMTWPVFKACLCCLCAVAHLPAICGVPLADLRHDAAEQGENKIRALTKPLPLDPGHTTLPGLCTRPLRETGTGFSC